MPKARAHSKIQKLGVEELVDNLLLANATYKEITEAVEKATGQKLGKSSLSRYQMRWQEERYREETIAKEVDAMMALLQQKPDVDPADGAMLLIKRKLVSRLAQAEANFDQTDALDLAHVLIRMKRLDQMGGQLKVQEERLALLQARVKTTAEKVKTELQAANVPGEKIAQMVDEILGVAA